MREKITKEKVDAAYKALYDLMKEKYSAKLLVSEMNEIIDAVEKVNESTNELWREKCDVVGCEKDADNGGCQWKESGYWALCNNHFSDGQKGLPQPEMKPEAINREKSRNKNGTLPIEKYSFD